jgi:hypothetical protein
VKLGVAQERNGIVKTVLINSAIAILLTVAADVQANSAVNAWESEREKVTDATVLDLRDYPHHRYLPPEKFSLFARCVAEKRIQLAKRRCIGTTVRAASRLPELGSLCEPAKAIIAGSSEDLPLRRGDDRCARRLCSAATSAAWCWLAVATLPAG